MCQRLIEFGLDPNRRSNQGSGRTPLHCTLDFDHVKTFQMFVELGVDVNSVTLPAIHEMRSTAIMKYMLSKPDLWLGRRRNELEDELQAMHLRDNGHGQS